MRRMVLIAVLYCIPVALGAQVYDQKVTIQRSEQMMESYSRKMDALLEEIGLIAIDAPSYVVDNMDVVSWLKEHRPSVYADNREFLEAFARDYLGITSKEEAPHQLLEHYHQFYGKVTEAAEKIARRLVGAWRGN